jgi:hypothetical protein
MSDNQEDSAGIQDLVRLCLPGRSRAKFTTTAAGGNIRALVSRRFG